MSRETDGEFVSWDEVKKELGMEGPEEDTTEKIKELLLLDIEDRIGELESEQDCLGALAADVADGRLSRQTMIILGKMFNVE